MDNETTSRMFNKIDGIIKDVGEIKITIAKLPCDVHEEKFKSEQNVIYRMWAIIMLLLAGLLGVAWKVLAGS